MKTEFLFWFSVSVMNYGSFQGKFRCISAILLFWKDFRQFPIRNMTVGGYRIQDPRGQGLVGFKHWGIRTSLIKFCLHSGLKFTHCMAEIRIFPGSGYPGNMSMNRHQGVLIMWTFYDRFYKFVYGYFSEINVNP